MARDGMSMVYDVARQEALLFGGDLRFGASGCGAAELLGDTWSFGERAPAIPALSQWGVVVMGLLLLSAGVMVARRRAAA